MKSLTLKVFLSFTVGLCLTFFANAQSVKVESPKELPELHIEGELNGLPGESTIGKGYANVEVEGVEPGGRYHLVVDLTNAWVDNIEFDAVKSSSDCANISPGKGVLVANEKFRFELDLKCPPSSRSGRYAFSVALLKDGSQVANLNFRLALSANLHIPENYQLLVRPDSEGEFCKAYIPIAITDPLDLAGLVASTDESFGDFMQCTVVDVKGEGPFVQLKMKVEDTPDSLVAGELKLVHRSSGKVATCDLLVGKVADVSLSPRLIQFRAPKGGVVDASAILEVSQSLLPEGSEVDWSSKFAFEATSGDLKWKVWRLSSTLYRVKFFLTQDESNPDEDGRVAKEDVLRKLKVTVNRADGGSVFREFEYTSSW